MTLKRKQKNTSDFSHQLNNERAYRSLSIDEDLFKSLKMKSIEQSKSLYEMLNDNLKEVIDTKMAINPNTTKNKTKKVVKAFAVNKQILIEAKKYSLEYNYTVKELLLAALTLK